jgi:4-cresol dehydrogenase (hydroxylating)
VLGLLQGIPTTASLASAYWRKRTPVPDNANPDRDGCGLLWCAPLAPLQGDHVRAVVRLASKTLLTYGYEPIISLTLITGRAVACIIAITYDRSISDEDDRAMQCYHKLLGGLREAGYYSYRLGIQGTNIHDRDSSSEKLLRDLKSTLDPNNILSPGRYQPRR